MIEHQSLSTHDQDLDPRRELIATAHNFYHQGWMMGTAGNLSIRLPDGSFWITASGRSKGKLSDSDFVRIYPDGKVAQSSPDLKPSAETAIHQILYTLFPETQACYHVHSIEANLVSRFVQGDTLILPPLEMLKGLGVREENPRCVIPIFANHLEVFQIAAEIKERFSVTLPQVSALLIRDHGVTVWASSPETARNYIELVEYIFRYMVASRQVGIGERGRWGTRGTRVFEEGERGKGKGEAVRCGGSPRCSTCRERERIITNAQCPMPNAQCPITHSLFPID